MPGYILHLTAAKIFWNQAKNQKLYNENDFYVGNLLPDTTSDKKVSHFRNPEYYGNMIEYPDLEMFLNKYRGFLDNSVVFGYYFHLYVDRRFFKEYFPSKFELLDDELKIVKKMNETAHVRIRETGEIISRKIFFSDEYYYGDYTKMNNYLIEQFNIDFEFKIPEEDRIITEVNYERINKVLQELRVFTQRAVDSKLDLKVFDLDDLLSFLKRIVEEW